MHSISGFRTASDNIFFDVDGKVEWPKRPVVIQ